jgi:hypothetical protein
MPIYEVTFPIIRGFEVIEVEAENENDAIQQALNGNILDTEYTRIETDFDRNLATVSQTD